MKQVALLLLALSTAGCETLLGLDETSVGHPEGDANPAPDRSLEDSREPAGPDRDASLSPDEGSIAETGDARSADGPDAPTPEASPDRIIVDVTTEAPAGTDGDGAEDVPGPEVDAETPDRSPDDADSDVALDGTATEDAPWSPRSMSGLVLWLDAAVGVSADRGAVTLWQDQSPLGHRAEPQYVNLRPTLVSNGIGTYPGISFAGKGDILIVKDHPSLQFGTKPFVIAVVFRHSTPFDNPSCPGSSYGALIRKQQAFPPFFGPSMWANYPIFDDGGTVAGLAVQTATTHVALTDTTGEARYNDDVPRVLGFYRAAPGLVLRINGAPVATNYTVPLDDVSAPGEDVTIGGARDLAQCLVGVISEIVAAAPVTFEETVALEQYLVRKHSSVIR